MISVAISDQLLQICYMLGAGAFALVLLDILREIGRLAKWTKYKSIVAEFMLFVLLGVCLCIFLIIKYHGVLRMYTFFALLLGAIAYYRLLYPYSIIVCGSIAKGILWLYCRITTILLFPWRTANRYIFKRAKKKVQQIRKHRKEIKLAELEQQEVLEKII